MPARRSSDGWLHELTWPDFRIRLSRRDERDLLVLTGPEPDYRWPRLAIAVVDAATSLGVTEWISIGAIPAAVPHTRAVPILGTASQPGLLRGNIRPGPQGMLRVPAALVSVLEMAAAEAGLEAVGYFAQVPHYVNGAYPPAAVELLTVLGRHLGVEVPLGDLPALALHRAVANHLEVELGTGDLVEESEQLRIRLDAATAADENTRGYVERLEAMVDEERLPAGDDLISEIEQFLRDQGSSRS